MDIHNWIIIRDWIMGIHNSITDIHNLIMRFWLSICHNLIMDIHNYRVYALLAFHMSQLIHIKKISL